VSSRYTPLPVPTKPEDTPAYLQEELKRISITTNNLADGNVEKVYVEPPKPRAGDKRYADGTNWNPGQGENLYYYDGTNWIAYAGGSGAGDFAQVDDTTSHTASSVDTPTAITWNTVPYSQGISVNSTDTSKIEFTNSGKYYIHFSCLLESNSSSNKEIWIFPRINGTDVDGSTIYHTLAANGHKRTLSKGGIFEITAGDYLQAMFAVDDTNLRLTTQAVTSFAPSAPSASIEIIQLSQ
jgi:hypothetical protein